jgi:hypothetical protein
VSVIGRVESLWRYPVKSMRGEELPEIFAGFAGVWGDRLFAFKSSAAPSPLLNPGAADPVDLALDVDTPSGEVLAGGMIRAGDPVAVLD